MKTIRLILMAALAMMSALAIHADDNIGLQGSGTWDDPYLINNCEDLMTLSHATNELGLDFAGKTLMLTSDIYMERDAAFVPISSHAEKPFRGVIDGNKHSIGGWKVNTWDTDNSTEAMTETPTALVVYLGEEGAIQNLTIDLYCSFTARGYFAPLVYDVQGTVSHCINRADIYADHEVGGLVYRVGPTGRVEDCFNEGSIEGAQRGFVGGIAARNSGIVARSQNTGLLKGSVYAQIGGIVGENTGGVSNCLSNGLLNGGSVIGGIVATAMAGSEVNSSLCTAVIWPGRAKDRVGAIAGEAETEKVRFSDNCFDRQICIYDNISADGIDGVDTQQLIDTIWSGSRAWTKQEGMYPQLWNFHQERTSILGAATIVFKHGDTRLTMTAPAKLYHNLTDSFWWTLNGDEAFYIDDEGRLAVRPCDHDVSTILYANHGAKSRFIPITAIVPPQVDINDVNTVINLILRLHVDNPDYNGDINGDGTVDIDDVNLLINQILAQ